MANKDFLLQLTAKLKEYLDQIEEFKLVGEQKFADDPRIYWMVDHGLHLAIQSCIDIAKEIIVILKLRKPRKYKEIFIILQQKRIISHEVGDHMQELAEFHNRLIHEYLFMNPKEIYRIYTKKRIYLYRFAKDVVKWLKTQKKSQ
ncbi:MAG: hypothetical protein UX30_C0019G0002 [Candidatus Saccharibacteria bacterium GW2011_GWA2_46_10]|nr:MAG: hypothetical protein UX30_C0019G0002 [Candidatus Saccharibacteria bacterium GW2011_GWA2_46_10]